MFWLSALSPNQNEFIAVCTNDSKRRSESAAAVCLCNFSMDWFLVGIIIYFVKKMFSFRDSGPKFRVLFK